MAVLFNYLPTIFSVAECRRRWCLTFKNSCKSLFILFLLLFLVIFVLSPDHVKEPCYLLANEGNLTIFYSLRVQEIDYRI